ncbi:hypothetical protein Pdca_05550 [Pseudonocardia autotrophica]|nr:hypothetical protein Pdca_05550 [Pseudonocardia autotrophica]
MAATPTGNRADRRPVLGQWRDVAATRGFLPFSVAMIGTYVLSYQVYLALPLHARTLAGQGDLGTALVTALYVVSGGVTIAAQMKVTAWCRARWGRPVRSVVAWSCSVRRSCPCCSPMPCSSCSPTSAPWPRPWWGWRRC